MSIIFPLSCLLVVVIFAGILIAAMKPLNCWLIVGSLLVGFTLLFPLLLEKIFNVSEYLSSRVFFSFVTINFCYAIVLIFRGLKKSDKRTIICGVSEFAASPLYIFLFLVAEMWNSA